MTVQSDKIIKIRKQKGLTQQQMASKLGWSRRVYQNKERGSANIDELIKICEVLDLKCIIIEKELIE